MEKSSIQSSVFIEVISSSNVLSVCVEKRIYPAN